MKILYDIIEQAMNGDMPTREECYYGMLAYRSLFTLEHNNLLKMLSDEKERPSIIKKVMVENLHNTYKTALNKSPQDWLGPEHDPMTDTFKKRYEIGKNVLDKLLNKVTARGESQ